MKTKYFKNMMISVVLIIMVLVQPVVMGETDNKSFSLQRSRVVDSSRTSGQTFTNERDIKKGVYVLCKFTLENVDSDGIGSAKLKFEINDTDTHSVYLDEIPDDWTTSSKYSNTYGDSQWNVTPKISSANSVAGKVSFDILDNIKNQLENGNGSDVYYAFYTEAEQDVFNVIKDSVMIEIDEKPAYQNFNEADEENIEYLILKYIESDFIDEYKEFEDKSFVNLKILEKNDYESLDEIKEIFENSINAYHVDLINAADNDTIEDLLLKYLSNEVLENYNALEDKSEVNEIMADKDDYISIAEIEEALINAINNYYERNAYLFEEGYYKEFSVFDYATAEYNQHTVGDGYAYVGAYNNSNRPMFKFDLRDIELDKVRSIKISYDVLPTYSTWYTYSPEAEYTTNFVKMHNNWQSSEKTYDSSFFADTTIVGTTQKIDKGSYATLITDVTEDVKSRGLDSEFISYYLMNVSTDSKYYAIDKTCNIKMLVEYANDAQGSYTSNISNGEEEIPINSSVILDFDKTLNQDTVIKDNISITENDVLMNDYTVSVDNNQIIINFPNKLKYGKTYKVKVKSNVMFRGDSLHYYFSPVNFSTEVEVFENDGLILIDTEGKMLTSLENVSGTVTAKTRLKNNKIANAQKMIISLVLIEETEFGDILKDKKIAKANLEMGEEVKLEKDFDLADGKYRIECLVWDSFKTRKTKSIKIIK